MRRALSKRLAIWLGIVIFGGVVAPGVQQPGIISGTLESDLVVDRALTWNAVLKPITLEESGKLGVEAPNGALAFSGTIRMSGGQAPLLAVLLEQQGSSARLYVDTDRDGRCEEREAHFFLPLLGEAKFSSELLLRVPLKTGTFRDFPVRVRLCKPDAVAERPTSPDQRVLQHSIFALATGTVEVGGKSIRVWCGYNPQKGTVDPATDPVGLDLNGDGELGPPTSLERVDPRGADAIFRVGNVFLSLGRLDLEKHQILMHTRAASEYRVVEIKAGTVVPDFDFTDFDGKPRRLSEFAGRYVLLDFWGSWCGPCVAEFPHLKRAWAELRNRGLEIVGIDCNEPVEEGRKAVAEHQLSWTQATAESTRGLVEQQLRIMAYPTKILLDGQRRIVLSEQGGANLSGEKLLETLDMVLPAAPRKK